MPGSAQSSSVIKWDGLTRNRAYDDGKNHMLAIDALNRTKAVSNDSIRQYAIVDRVLLLADNMPLLTVSILCSLKLHVTALATR